MKKVSKKEQQALKGGSGIPFDCTSYCKKILESCANKIACPEYLACFFPCDTGS